MFNLQKWQMIAGRSGPGSVFAEGLDAGYQQCVQGASVSTAAAGALRSAWFLVGESQRRCEPASPGAPGAWAIAAPWWGQYKAGGQAAVSPASTDVSTHASHTTSHVHLHTVHTPHTPCTHTHTPHPTSHIHTNTSHIHTHTYHTYTTLPSHTHIPHTNTSHTKPHAHHPYTHTRFPPRFPILCDSLTPLD